MVLVSSAKDILRESAGVAAGLLGVSEVDLLGVSAGDLLGVSAGFLLPEKSSVMATAAIMASLSSSFCVFSSLSSSFLGVSSP